MEQSTRRFGRGLRREAVSVSHRRIGTPRNRIRLTGRTLGEVRLLAADERSDLLSLVDHASVVRLGHRHRLPALTAVAPGDHVSVMDALLTGTASGLTEALLNDVLAPVLEPTWDRFVDHLGEHSSRPTAEQLIDAGHRVVAEQSVHRVRVFLAAVVELSFPARDEVLSLDPRTVPFALAPDTRTTPITRPPDTAPAPARREARRQRRKAESEQRAARRAQRASGRRQPLRQRRPPATVTTSLEVEPESDIPLEAPVLERLEHPRLPAEAKIRTGSPVGHRGQTVIGWGPLPTQRKARPVVIVGASKHHLWIRAVYTRDLVAGRWRSTRIDDWEVFGLDHPSFVDIDVRRITRKSCKISDSLMSVRDWNRVCRGEVHD